VTDVKVNLDGDAAGAVRASKQARNALDAFNKAAWDASKATEGAAKSTRKLGNDMEETAHKGKGLIQWTRDFSRDFFFLTNIFNQFGQAAVSAFKAVEESARGMVAEQFFRNAGRSLEDFRTATRGLISDAELMKKVNLADSMGISGETFKDLSKVAAAASSKTGQSFDHMFNSIIVGTARSSRLLLDNLGIIISVKEANQNYAKSLKEADETGQYANMTVEQLAESLSNEAKQLAFVEEVSRKSKDMTAEHSEIAFDAAAKFDQFSAAIENLKDAFIRLATSGMGKWLDSLTDGIVALTRLLTLSKNVTAAEAIRGAWACMKKGATNPDGSVNLSGFNPINMVDNALSGMQAAGESKNDAIVKWLMESDKKLRAAEIHWRDLLAMTQSQTDNFADLYTDGPGSELYDIVRNFKAVNMKAVDSPYFLTDSGSGARPGTEDPSGGGGGGTAEKEQPWVYAYQKEMDEREKLNASFREYHKKWRKQEEEFERLRDKQASITAEALDKQRKEYIEAHSEVEKARERQRQVWREVDQSEAAKFSTVAGVVKAGVTGNASGALGGAGSLIGAAAGGPFGAALGGAVGTLVGEFLAMMQPVIGLFKSISEGFKLLLAGFEPFLGFLDALGPSIMFLLYAIGHFVGSVLRPWEPVVDLIGAALASFISIIAFLVTAAAPFAEMLVAMTSFLQPVMSILDVILSRFGVRMLSFGMMMEGLAGRVQDFTWMLMKAAVNLNNGIIEIVRGIGGMLNDATGSDFGLSNFGDYTTKYELVKLMYSIYGKEDESTEDNTDATDDNTKAVRDLTQELRNLPAGYKVAGTMYRSQDGAQRIPTNRPGSMFGTNPRDYLRTRY
jgi:hypothetical protein